MFGRSETQSNIPFALTPAHRRDHVASDASNDITTSHVLQKAWQFSAHQRRLNPDTYPPDPELDALLPAEFYLEYRVLPWGRVGNSILVGTPPGRDLTQLRDIMEKLIGPVMFADVAEADLLRIVEERHGDYLADRAERLVPDDYSCRDINKLTLSRGILASLFFGICLALERVAFNRLHIRRP